MLTPLEIYNGTRGALRLLRFDPAGAAYYDNTVEAFWRSFRVMVLVAPFYVLLRVLFYESRAAQAGDVEILIVETLRYLIEWFFFPVVVFELARWLDLKRNYLRYIAALNWMNVPLLPIALAMRCAAEIAPQTLLAFQIGIQLLAFIWFCAVTRLVLETNWGVVLGLYLLANVSSELFASAADRIIGLGV